MKLRALLLLSIVFGCLALPTPALAAWWNAEWKHRKQISIDTGALGLPADAAAVSGIPVAVRLHSGNFVFTDAKPDGSDIRFVAADDKTPLKHHVEVYDSANQLAILWVQVPRVAATGRSEPIWMYSGNAAVGAGEDAKGVYAPAGLLQLHFGEAGGAFKDQSAYGHLLGPKGVTVAPDGVAGAAAAFAGEELRVASTTVRVTAASGGGVTFSAWVRPAAGQKAQLFAWGGWVVELSDDEVASRVGRVSAAGKGIAPGAWTHVAATLGAERMNVFVNGKEAGAAALKLPDLAGDMVVGAGFRGDMDAVEVSGAARPPLWFAIQAAQGPESTLLTYGEPESGETGGDHGYIGVLADSLTIDAKVVIVLCAFMLVVAVWVMITKAVLVARTDSHNSRFLELFESKPVEYLDPRSAESRSMREGGAPSHSSLARLYSTGMRELDHRFTRRQGAGLPMSLSGEALAAIKASIDSTLIRENQRLNRMMVLLTIAISGGPFLGLLGTVVGVMITFAAIAASGDVNINSIAPGIAAALLATVAGLGVAIPSLFGYNYLLTRIKNITADMQAFSDEFVTKMAEVHNP